MTAKTAADLRSEYRRRFKRRYLDQDAPVGPAVRKAILADVRSGVPLAQSAAAHGLTIQSVAAARRALPEFDLALRRAADMDASGVNRRYATACLHPAISGASGYRKGCRCPRCKAGHSGRTLPRDIPVAAFGEAKTLAEWARDPRAAVTSTAIRDRLAKGWDIEDAITAPATPVSPKIDQHRVLELRRQGVAMEEIARRVGASFSRVQSICQMADLRWRESAVPRSRTEPLPPQVRSHLHDLAERVAASRGRRAPGSPAERASRDLDQLLAELNERGYAAPFLAAELGYRVPNQVSRRISRHRQRTESEDSDSLRSTAGPA